ncbi:ClpX C4-type zinc finger protein [Vreelandella sp. EE27]
MICCDFCGKSEHQEEALIAAKRPGDGGNVAICGGCAKNANRIAEEKQIANKTERPV